MKLRESTFQALGRRSEAAFTLVEIALCIAIVAFAMVAIIGVLPTGLEVQRENREDTVVNQDAQVFMDTIRSASTNAAVLTNNIEWIEFTVTVITNSSTNVSFFARHYATNLTPRQVLGWLCAPRYTYTPGSTNIYRNLIKCRAISRPLAMEATNVQDMTFSYLFSTEVIPVDRYITAMGSEYNAMRTNLWDLRMTFEWPVLRDLTNGSTVGNGYRSIRSTVAARLFQEDEYNNSGVVTNTLWYFTPGSFSPF